MKTYEVLEWFDDVPVWRGIITAQSEEDACQRMREIDQTLSERLSAREV